MSNPQSTYSPDEARRKLAIELPHWLIDNGMLARTFHTSGWKATMMVVVAIGHLAEAAWHHPDLAVSYAKVVVRLTTHSAGGITDMDFALARKIEEWIGWQPAQEGGPLAGTPNQDPRFKYIEYD